MADERFTRRERGERAGAREVSGWQAMAESIFGAEARSHLLRYGSHALLIGVGLAAVWLAGLRLPERLPNSAAAPGEAAGTEAVAAAPAASVEFIPADFSLTGAIFRLAQIHTDRPEQPRNEIRDYTVQPGDTLFGIAQKFGLKPETIIWSNRLVLQDDPHSLRPGMEFKIPPVDGVLYKVLSESDTLEGIAKGTNVTVDDIINWPENDLDPDPANVKLAVGQYLMIPGGTGKIYQWEAPQPIVQGNKGSTTTRLSDGAGSCGGSYNRISGTGYFIWPADTRYLSGTDFTSYHAGIDLAAGMGQPVYAADSGVVIFAGPNNYGYGNMVQIDHGNGWTTLYGHLSQWNVNCFQTVSQGQVVGLAGSTGRSSGPHLHFETAYNGVRINPWTVLPGQ